MMLHASRWYVRWLVPVAGILTWMGAAHAQAETSLAALLAGNTVPQTLRLRELSSDWRRVTVAGEMMLGMGGMQSLMQGVGSMFGGGAGTDALYTRGHTVKIGDQQFLVAYRLPAQGVDFGSTLR